MNFATASGDEDRQAARRLSGVSRTYRLECRGTETAPIMHGERHISPVLQAMSVAEKRNAFACHIKSLRVSVPQPQHRCV